MSHLQRVDVLKANNWTKIMYNMPLALKWSHDCTQYSERSRHYEHDVTCGVHRITQRCLVVTVFHEVSDLRYA